MYSGEYITEMSDMSWGRTPSSSHHRFPNCYEAEDAIRSNTNNHNSHSSGLYYSPPGTSYTIVERPSSNMRPCKEYQHSKSAQNIGMAQRRTPVMVNGKKRPISPEQVLRMLSTSGHHGRHKEKEIRSPASSPPSTLHKANSFLSPTPVPSVHSLQTRTVTMIRDPPDGTHGFGICVKGGRDSGVGVYISRVEEDSVAERAGLRPGDTILEVNGTPFTGISHEEALKMLKSCRKISMTVKSPSLGSWANYDHHMNFPVRHTCSWIDRQGRPVSPPYEYSGKHKGRESQIDDGIIRRVDLCIEAGQSLGLMIRGGVEYNLGIFITGVDKGSVADTAGLNVGDQILEVNGHSFMDITHDEAVHQLKYHKRMSLIVKDVGKVPHSCTAFEDDISPGAAIAKKWSAALQMVEEKAKSLFGRSDFGTFCYYTDEYAAKNMSVEAFVQVLLELLNTPEKLTLLTEVREIVAVDDRNKFDELVYANDVAYRNVKEHRKHRDFGPAVEAVTRVYTDADFRSPSEDSGLGLGIADRALRIRPASALASSAWSKGVSADLNIYHEDNRNCQGYNNDGEDPLMERGRRHSSPGDSRSGSVVGLHQDSYLDTTGYFGGLRSHFGDWTQKMKSWYWGKSLDMGHKLSRSFEMNDKISSLEDVRKNHAIPRLSSDAESTNEKDAPRVVTDAEGNLRVTVRKSKPILGIAIEGGANTRHPLPRIINIHEHGAAYNAGGLEVGQLILEVDGQRVKGLQHQDVARLIAESFARRDRDDIEFLVVEAKKSNMEPKPTALIFLEA